METINGGLASTLKIEPGITAIIGSGGKSTLLKTLGLELMRAGGRVLLCTTTHMFPVAGVPWDGSSRRLDAAPWKPGAYTPQAAPASLLGACAGKHLPSWCLGPRDGQALLPAEALDQLAQRFDYAWPRQTAASGSRSRPTPPGSR